MGCWDENCAITDCPIRGGERVIMIDTGDSGFGEELIPPQLYLHRTRFYRGTYNTYGGIEELEESDRDYIFIKESVWDAILGLPDEVAFQGCTQEDIDKFSPRGIEALGERGCFLKGIPLSWEDASDLVKVHAFAVRARIDLREPKFKGQQCEDDIPAYEQRIELMNRAYQDYIKREMV